jgi:endonuclease/exonuclease/phosphatase family metal-dependent hydrolase
MTCNIRIAGLEADDTIPGRKWEDRRDVMLKVINSRKPDIICTQEVIYKSYYYMKKKLSKYGCFGFEGPEMDPYTNGYHFIGKNVIFWRKSRYELVSSGCYWLSDKPYIGGSLSWGTTRARHCNWVRLRDRKTGEEFRILDVHLDHISEPARQAQIKMVIEETSQYQSSFPQILCGDFNSGIKNVAVKALHSSGWKDLYEEIHGSGEAGYTCHGFFGTEKALKGHKGHRIDFIFGNGPVDAIDSEIIKDSIRGIYPSDHYFLMADVTL